MLCWWDQTEKTFDVFLLKCFRNQPVLIPQNVLCKMVFCYDPLKFYSLSDYSVHNAFQICFRNNFNVFETF